MAPKKPTKSAKTAPKTPASEESKKPSAKRASGQSVEPPSTEEDGTPKKKKASGTAAIAEQIIEDENATKRVGEYGAQLLDDRATTATQAARVLSEIHSKKPELLVGLVDKLVQGITSSNKRVVQTAADVLPTVARIAPARVARHLDRLKTAFDETNDTGKDGLVRTFAALCTASVAYQKRLEPVLTKALEYGQGKVLFRWAETVLPALKGEPHARARAVVEQRLYKIPRSVAQQIADFLGIKLRPNVH